MKKFIAGTSALLISLGFSAVTFGETLTVFAYSKNPNVIIQSVKVNSNQFTTTASHDGFSGIQHILQYDKNLGSKIFTITYKYDKKPTYSGSCEVEVSQGTKNLQIEDACGGKYSYDSASHTLNSIPQFLVPTINNHVN